MLEDLLALGKVIVYGKTFDPIGGLISDINDVWMYIEAEDGKHFVRVSDVNHIKAPKNDIEGFVNADL